MKDEEVLKKLYLLQGLKSGDRESFITEWINDTLYAIAKESEANIGFGNALKTIKKYRKSNEKIGIDGLVKTSKRGNYIFTNSFFAVRTRADLGLPLTDNKDLGDRLLKCIEDSAKSNKTKVPLPTRADLDAIIRIYKATPKEKREKFPIYDFGEGLPQVNAEYLLDILPFFTMQINGYVDKSKGSKSSLYISFSPFEGVLLPVTKKER